MADGGVARARISSQWGPRRNWAEGGRGGVPLSRFRRRHNGGRGVETRVCVEIQRGVSGCNSVLWRGRDDEKSEWVRGYKACPTSRCMLGVLGG